MVHGLSLRTGESAEIIIGISMDLSPAVGMEHARLPARRAYSAERRTAIVAVAANPSCNNAGYAKGGVTVSYSPIEPGSREDSPRMEHDDGYGF